MRHRLKYRRLKFLGYPNYRIGTDGSIWSKIVKGSPIGRKGKWRKRVVSNEEGRREMIQLWHNGIGKTFSVPELVLLAFVGPRPRGCVVRHFPDRDVSNNNLNNLSWSTYKQNQADRITHGTDHRGEKQWMAKLTEEKVRRMRKLYTFGWTQHQLANKFKVHQTLVSLIVKLRSWKHVPPEPYNLKFFCPYPTLDKGLYTRLSTNPGDLYTQLVCWCFIQRYWYYVLERPKVSDQKYDRIEAFVGRLERKHGFYNEYSPTRNVGSSNPETYPYSIQRWFNASNSNLHGRRTRRKTGR